MFVNVLLILIFGIINSSSCFRSTSLNEQIRIRYYPVACKPSDSFIRDPTDCNIFYQCMYSLPIKMACANGLCFNSMTELCDWCDLVPECSTRITTEKLVQTTSKPSNSSMPCPVMNLSIFLAHPNTCTKFYYCKRNQLIGKIGYCAEGLWFNFWRQRCELPWERVCKKSTSQ